MILFRISGAAVAMVVHSFHQFGGGHAEGSGDAQDAKHAGVAHAALDTADVRGVEAGKFGERFLGQLFFFASLPNVQTKHIKTLIPIPHVALTFTDGTPTSL
jgi:hypothetical protein